METTNLETLWRLTRELRHLQRRARGLSADHADYQPIVRECLRLRARTAALRHGIWGRAAAAR